MSAARARVCIVPAIAVLLFLSARGLAARSGASVDVPVVMPAQEPSLEDLVTKASDYLHAYSGKVSGVSLDEVDTRTLESRLCPGLFLCGEILDAFGPIGGHNFAWAWATGRLAGMGAATQPTTGN